MKSKRVIFGGGYLVVILFRDDYFSFVQQFAYSVISFVYSGCKSINYAR